MVAWATAAELARVELADALALVLLALDADAPRFDKAAVRWHSRLCREAPLTLDEAQLALSALRALAGPSRKAATDALLGIAKRHGLREVSAALEASKSHRSATPEGADPALPKFRSLSLPRAAGV